LTATQVDGVDVIADEPARAPMLDRAGNPIYHKQMRELLLSDGRTVYGCIHCDYTADSLSRVRPHLNKHRSGTKLHNGGAIAALAKQLTAQTAQTEALAAERDEWKRRASAAEKALRDLRKALGVGA
jgi:hypothetical protein